MWRIGKPPATAGGRTPPPAGRSGPRMPSREVLLAGGAAVVVVLALIHRRKATGSSNGASTTGGNPATPMVTSNGQGTYDSSGQDTANALFDMNTRLATIGNTLDALDPSKWPANVGAGVGPSGVPAPGGTAPVPGSGVAAATPAASGTAPAQLPWHKPAPLSPTPAARPLTGTAPSPVAKPSTGAASAPVAKPSTRALSTFDAASRAKLAAGKAVVGGDGRTMKLVNGVPTTISYSRVAPKPAPPAAKSVALPPRRKA